VSLRSQTSALTDLFRRRVSSLRGQREYLKPLRALNLEEAKSFGASFLGRGSHRAAGIDGSMNFDEVLELLVFYVCASGYSTRFNVDDDKIGFDLSGVLRIPGLSMSAAVPLWEEDLSNLIEMTDLESDPDLRRSRERIPFALMTMAELNLALEIIKTDEYKLLFLDRPLSGTFPGLNRDASTLLSRGGSSLVGLDTQAGQVSLADIYLAVGLGPGGVWVPPRGANLTYAAIKVLIEKGRLTRVDLGKALNIGPSELDILCSRLANVDKRLDGDLLEKPNDGHITLKTSLSNYWSRVVDASMQVASNIFKDSKHPLVDERGRWLTVLDLNTVNLFLTQNLAYEASKRGILIIGIAKDTSATEYTRAVLPFLLSREKNDTSIRPPEIKSDKALLRILSAVNSEDIPTPWRTPAYDACFTTLMWNPEDELPLKPARKIVSKEQMYVRSYFQLRSYSADPSVRSPVFLYDRLFMPEKDAQISQIEVIEKSGRTRLRPFMESEQLSDIDNLILYILSLSDNSEVMEAYGHNQLLYLADKYVKEEIMQMKGLLRGIIELELTPLARKEKVFTVARRFRDLRAASERARKRKARQTRG